MEPNALIYARMSSKEHNYRKIILIIDTIL